MSTLPLALSKATAAQQAKVRLVMHEHKQGTLRSWRGTTKSGKPRKGPVVRSRAQAIAIAMNQAGISKMAPMAVMAPPRKPPAPPPDMSGCCDARVAHVHAHHAHGIIRRKGKERADGVLDQHVLAVMGTVNELLPKQVMATPISRMQHNAAVSDHTIPLAHLVR